MLLACVCKRWKQLLQKSPVRRYVYNALHSAHLSESKNLRIFPIIGYREYLKRQFAAPRLQGLYKGEYKEAYYEMEEKIYLLYPMSQDDGALELLNAASMYTQYQKINGFILVFSYASQWSLEALFFPIERLKKIYDRTFPCVLVGLDKAKSNFDATNLLSMFQASHHPVCCMDYEEGDEDDTLSNAIIALEGALPSPKAQKKACHVM